MGGSITPYSITELSGAVAVCAGALGAVLVALFKSRCTEISCGWGCFKCVRDVGDASAAVEDDEAAAAPQDEPQIANDV